MKGDIAMKKLDLISDEYIHEAEIPEDLDVIVIEKQSFWQKLSHFMNSPVGVAMLCAVVSLSVLVAIVLAGTGRWSGWQPPAGTHVETESSSTQVVTLPLIEALDSKSFVPEFYQALKDKDMIGKIPAPAVDGGLTSSDDPIYIVKEEDIHNVTPLDIYEETGAMIFNAGVMVYLWMDGEIYILNQTVVFGSGFTGAVLCDYDQNGTEDIFCGYITSLSGVWYTDFVVFDVTDKALRHNLQRTPSDDSSSSAIIGCRVFCDLGVIQKRIADGKDYYDIVKPTGELIATYMPSPEGLVYLPPITDIPELVPTVFSQYMNKYCFVGGLGQSEFIDGVLGKFSYEGQPLNEMPITMGDGELLNGGFCTIAEYGGDVASFSFGHISEHPDNNRDHYNYYLSTQTTLEGFALPYSMVFGDTFEQALIKMSLEDAHLFTPGATSTVLYRVGSETLTVIYEDIAAAFSYQLVFEETETSSQSKDRSMTVTRKLTLSFGQDLKLLEVAINVSTHYSVNTEPSTEIPVLTPAVQADIKKAFFEQNVPEADQGFYSIDDLSIRSFGTYGGGFVVFVDGIFDYTQAFEYETVLGIEFEYNTGQKLLYYKDGQFYSLPEAAGAGLLSQADIQKLHEVYTN